MILCVFLTFHDISVLVVLAAKLCLTVAIKESSLRVPRYVKAILIYPQNSPGKNTGLGRHFLLQVILLTQG